MRLEDFETSELPVAHEIQTEGVVEARSIKSALIRTEPESSPIHRSDDTGRCETITAVPDWPFLINGLFGRGIEQHAEKAVDLLLCDSLNIEETRNKLNNVTSCSERFRESSSRMLGN